jgi:hypothetical protein
MPRQKDILLVFAFPGEFEMRRDVVRHIHEIPRIATVDGPVLQQLLEFLTGYWSVSGVLHCDRCTIMHPGLPEEAGAVVNIFLAFLLQYFDGMGNGFLFLVAQILPILSYAEEV